MTLLHLILHVNEKFIGIKVYIVYHVKEKFGILPQRKEKKKLKQKIS